MTRYIFDPARLGRAGKRREDPYLAAGRLLREYLGGDVLAEVRRRVRSDPRFRELLDELRVASAKAEEVPSQELKRRAVKTPPLAWISGADGDTYHRG